jgi:hypothetical protein
MDKTTENDPSTVLSPAFRAASKIRHAKKDDYGGIKDYFPFADASYVQMIHVKTKRLVSLTVNSTTPSHESIKDNLLDLINYASYYYEWLEGGLDE